MSDSIETDREISRRELVAAGGAVAGALTLGSLVEPLSALAWPWPQGRLRARDAYHVDPHQFMPKRQFRQWHEHLENVGPDNQQGLRATGSWAHEHYVDHLRDQLERAGVKRVHFEPVPMKRWTTQRWSLDLLSGRAAGPVRTASYIPYTGRTPPGGATGPLVYVPPGSNPRPGSLVGKIAVFDVQIQIVPLSFFTSLGYPGKIYDPHQGLDPAQQYKRPYLNQVVPVLDQLAAAGAAGAVGVLDYPANGADGSYFPYDGIIRDVPGLYVDRDVGAELKERARAGARARLRLPAEIRRMTSRNLIGFIPGKSRELVALHCHTDGTNAIEDNGPGAIVAASQYLARLPRHALESTIMILLTTGHFHGGNGSRAFCRRHADDLVPRTKAAVTIEHLGAREWDELPSGRMGPTGNYEPGGIFAPGSKALVNSAFKALESGHAAPGVVLKPLNPTASGVANDPAWPGEGQYLFAVGGISDANYITGPTYLLNWGIKSRDKVSFDRIRRETIAFTEMALRLARKSRHQLNSYTL